MRELMKEHGSDKPMIVTKMREAIADEPAVAEIVIGLGIDQCYQMALHRTRSASWNTAVGEGPVIAGMHNSMSAYDFPLPSGQKLGDATAADLDAAVKVWSDQARGHLRNVKWITAVRKAMGKSKTVRAGVPIEILVKLQRKADEETGIEV